MNNFHVRFKQDKGMHLWDGCFQGGIGQSFMMALPE
jgi:hypothetical protein